MNAKEILEQAVNGVLQEKALSKEAIDAVQQVLAENEDLKAGNESLRELTANQEKSLAIAQKKNAEYDSLVDALAAREKALQERENKADLLDLQVEHAKIRVADLKEITGLVFRNTVLKKTMYNSSQVPMPSGGYMNNVTENSNETISEE